MVFNDHDSKKPMESNEKGVRQQDKEWNQSSYRFIVTMIFACCLSQNRGSYEHQIRAVKKEKGIAIAILSCPELGETVGYVLLES